jgi:hypothetical protein
MTATLTRAPSRPSLLVRYRLTPWWVKVLVIFVGSRIITTIILLVYAAMQAANPWTGAHPDYFSFAHIWDGTWYNFVATYGYPVTLPHDAVGHVTQNTWAFLPLYPFLSGGISFITSLPFDVVGVFVSVAFAAGTALVLYKLLLPQLGASTALFSVVLFCVAPLSPIYQVDYAEPMGMFFLALALLYLRRRQYWVMLIFVALVSFTRPTGLAFALALGLHFIYRFVVRGRDPFTPRDIFTGVVTTGISGLLGYAWPFIAGVVTGVPDAYTATELSWRSPYVGYIGLQPFEPWIQGADWWMARIGVGGLVIPAVLLVLAVAAYFGLLFTPWAKRLGVDLRIWIASWAIYILAVFFPQSSVFRIFVPIFPALGAFAQPKSKIYRVALVLLFIAGQVAWVYMVWWFSDSDDWTPP